jgi:hypothetical protein
MEPGCYLLLVGREPPILATVTFIGTSHIEYDQFDDDRLKRHNTWGKCSPADFVDIGTHNHRKVFGYVSDFLNLQGLHRALQECKDKMLEKEDARLALEKRKQEARLALEKRQEDARLALERRKRIRELLDVALNLPFGKSTLIAPGEPEDEDIRLANEWINRQTAESTSEKTRMLSARMAEKAVIRYLSDRGEKPKDIAVLQLPEFASHDCEWVNYDIRVGDACIDVKNARRSKHNPHAFVRHCVPNFKTTRNGSSVIIAGALSKWLSLDKILNGESEVRFLGTTSADKLSQLLRMLTSSRLQLSVTSLNGRTFLPSWIFDYTAADYKSRDDALRQIAKLFDNLSIGSHLDVPGLMPALLAIGATDLINPKDLRYTWQFDFINCLNSRLKEYPFTLSVVFLSILEHFLIMLAKDDSMDYVPEAYREIVFYSTKWESPLFFCDPECAVYSLIESLATLWRHREESLLGLKIFRLHQLNVLSGKRDEHSPWKTILAYCGGWKKESGRSSPCGMTPLVYGQHDSCSCGKLICPKCGFCSNYEDCPKCEPRQSKLDALRNSLRKSSNMELS